MLFSVSTAIAVIANAPLEQDTHPCLRYPRKNLSWKATTASSTNLAKAAVKSAVVFAPTAVPGQFPSWTNTPPFIWCTVQAWTTPPGTNPRPTCGLQARRNGTAWILNCPNSREAWSAPQAEQVIANTPNCHHSADEGACIGMSYAASHPFQNGSLVRDGNFACKFRSIGPGYCPRREPDKRPVQARGKVTPCWPWYLPPRSR
jgi:hypothetical protein